MKSYPSEVVNSHSGVSLMRMLFGIQNGAFAGVIVDALPAVAETQVEGPGYIQRLNRVIVERFVE